jgi:hypothetical protein
MQPSLLTEIQAAADEERRTVTELLREAVEHYLENRRWQRLIAFGQEQARSLGLTEADVPRLIAEYREEKRQGRQVIGVTADSNIYVGAAVRRGSSPVSERCPRRFPAPEYFHGTPGGSAGVLRDKFKWLKPALDEAMTRLARFTSVVTPKLTLDVVHSDPDDNRVLECAVKAGSRFIVPAIQTCCASVNTRASAS